MIVLQVEGLTRLQEELRATVERVRAATTEAAEAAGEAVLPFVENHMHGPLPPKLEGSPPARRTGNLIGALTSEPLGPFGRRIFPDGDKAAYARRVERGFTGVDSIGRRYNQPPYPYLAPGWEDARPVIGRVFRDAWAGALTG